VKTILDVSVLAAHNFRFSS